MSLNERIELIYTFITNPQDSVSTIEEHRPWSLAWWILILAVLTSTLSVILVLPFPRPSLMMLFNIVIFRLVLTLCIWLVLTGIMHFFAELFPVKNMENTHPQPTPVSVPTIPISQEGTVIIPPENVSTVTPKVQTKPKIIYLFIYLCLCLMPLLLSLPLSVIVSIFPWGKILWFVLFNLLILLFIVRLEYIGIKRIYHLTPGKTVLVLSAPSLLFLLLFGIGIIFILISILNLSSQSKIMFSFR